MDCISLFKSNNSQNIKQLYSAFFAAILSLKGNLLLTITYKIDMIIMKENEQKKV
jgi:hypothetical protein